MQFSWYSKPLSPRCPRWRNWGVKEPGVINSETFSRIVSLILGLAHKYENNRSYHTHEKDNIDLALGIPFYCFRIYVKSHLYIYFQERSFKFIRNERSKIIFNLRKSASVGCSYIDNPISVIHIRVRCMDKKIRMDFPMLPQELSIACKRWVVFYN